MSRFRLVSVLLAAVTATLACGRSDQPVSGPATTGQPTAAATQANAEAAFTRLVDELVDDSLRRNPTQATYLGIHTHDDQLEDASRRAVEDESAALRAFRTRVAAIDPATLPAASALDHEQVLRAIDSQLLTNDVIRPWQTTPDSYSSGITSTAFIMIKRSFAPPEVRLKALIARERLMLRTLDEARRNLVNPPEVLTRIAIEQLDGNRDFFATTVPAAFASVKVPSLVEEFAGTNQAVVDALTSYKAFLEKDLLPRSKGAFAIGADTLAKKFAADEMVTLPLDRLLAIAQADLTRNQKAFAETAARIAPGKSPAAVADMLAADHPAPAQLLAVTQQMLDSMRDFLESHQLVTIPTKTPARVEETPPFLRATTSASMDTPGPFETNATEAFYNMTLPDPKWPKAQIDSFMKQWYYASISNVSVHEVWPGHYLQFVYGPQFPSKVRKVYGAASNAEGWAHYSEQMMLDEGFHRDEPKYRIAQLQDALLRDVRFIVGIKLHSQGMTVAAAQRLFEREAYQPPPVALSEAKRGTTDPTYGYYTMGKLMILKLRDDIKAKRGAAWSIRDFHDTFLKLGPLPLPLVRKAMLGDIGEPFPAGS
jgi:uncharacterized protein (DUF885 family)